MKKAKAAAALVLILALALTACGSEAELLDGDGMERTAYALVQAQFPQMAQYPEFDPRGEYPQEEMEKWNEDMQALKRELEFNAELQPFFKESVKTLLADSGSENRLISPLNLYLALSMLGDITAGESRDEILNLLNCPDRDTLRYRASELFLTNCRMDGVCSSLPANSIWLRQDSYYNEEELLALKEHYFASSFQGIMGSEEYDRLLRDWLSQVSGGIMDELAADEGFDEASELALCSSLMYKARWADSFSESASEQGSFHGTAGDRDCVLLKRSGSMSYLRGEDFGAISLPMAADSGSVLLVLPDEGKDAGALLDECEFMDMALNLEDWENKEPAVVNIALPKFSLSSETELNEGLERLGVKSVFNQQRADLSPLISEKDVYLSELRHAVKIETDEEGISAGAFSLMPMAAACDPPEKIVDFTLDRPFYIIIISSGGQPMFAGLINNI